MICNFALVEMPDTAFDQLKDDQGFFLYRHVFEAYVRGGRGG